MPTTQSTRVFGDTTVILEAEAGQHRLRIVPDEDDPVVGEYVAAGRAATATYSGADFEGLHAVVAKRLGLDEQIRLVSTGEEPA